MPFRTYSDAQKAEAVALASIVGADTAAGRLTERWGARIKPETIRAWSAQAGKRPELDTPSDELQGLYDLAVARVTSDVADGRIKGVALATVMGILRDKLDRAARLAERSAQPETNSALSAELRETERLLIETFGEGHAFRGLAALIWYFGEDGPAAQAAAEGRELTWADAAEWGRTLDLDAWDAARTAAWDAAARRATRAGVYASQGYPPAECWAMAEAEPDFSDLIAAAEAELAREIA